VSPARNNAVRVFFTGTYQYSIDGKGRVAIPAEIRQQIVHASQGNPVGPSFLYVTLGPNKNLCLYTDAEFQRLAESLDNSTMEPELLQQFEEMFFSNARRVEVDSQGRVLIPDQLLKDTGLTEGKVALLGVKDHLEIYELEAWKKRREETLAKNPGILDPRKASRNTQPAA
jgi:MraZ protein